MTKPIPYVPRWQGAIEWHAINTARKLYPMLCAEHEFDDLMQEAYLVYMHCKVKGKSIDNPGWFMAFFSTCLRNKLLNMAKLCGRVIAMETPPDMAADGDAGFERVVLSELPEQIKRLIRAVCYGPGVQGRAYRKLREHFPALA
jgi:DNA-directed RNA polymerase specialized sigma24 family protein